jgi:hypothetical protein
LVSPTLQQRDWIDEGDSETVNNASGYLRLAASSQKPAAFKLSINNQNNQL